MLNPTTAPPCAAATATNQNNSAPNTTYLGDSSLCLENETFFMLVNDVGRSNADAKSGVKNARKPRKTHRHMKHAFNGLMCLLNSVTTTIEIRIET